MSSPSSSAPASAPEERVERWRWRSRLRASPNRYRVYRLVVALIGVLLVLLGLVLGPFPGPGGIPLVLGGLAVLASEFAWARRILDRARRHLRAFTTWAGSKPRWLRVTGSLGLLVVALGGLWAFVVVLGVPSLLPRPVQDVLVHLPGAHLWSIG